MHQPTKLRILIAVCSLTMLLAYQAFTPKKAETHTIRYPIILIPGFSGTRFVSPDIGTSVDELPDGHGGLFSHYYPPEEEVWVNTLEAAKPGNDDYFDVMGLQSDGKTPIARLGLGGAVTDVYQPAIDFFISKGYVLNRDLYVFSYDWRQDVRDHFENLDDLIALAKSRTGQSRVNIIAHSMGGLVLRNYLSDPDKAQNIFKAVTLGTPHLGAPEVLKYLIYGGCLTNINTGPACVGIPPSEVKDILQNMTGAFQLIPSAKYYDFYNGSDLNHPMPFSDNSDLDKNGITGNLSYIQLKEMLTNLMYNTPLYTPAEELHSKIDTTLPVILGGQLTLIVGSGRPTLGQIEEKTVATVGNINLNKKDMHIINGDRSVPLLSASLSDPQHGQLLTGNAQVFYVNQDHTLLPSDLNTLNLINFIFNGAATGTYNYDGVSTQPYKLKGTLISVHSPIDINVYDQEGNHTGLTENQDIEQSIPGSYYETIDDAKFVWVPENNQYLTKLNSTGQGSFDLKIRHYNEDEITQEQLFENIPLNESTQGKITLDPSSTQNITLHLDNNGDGTIDALINPTVTSQDTTPPITDITIVGTQGEPGWFSTPVTIRATAQDQENGSGIDYIQYSINNGEPQQYNLPFNIVTEGTTDILIWATDKAGNKEQPQLRRVVVDYTPPEISVQFNTTQLTYDIAGIDNLSPTLKIETQSGEVLFLDSSWNKTKATYTTTNKKQFTQFQLATLTYNNSPAVQLSPNSFESHYEINKKNNTLQELQQKIIVENQEKVKTEFSAKANKTVIESKNNKEKTKTQHLDGLILLELISNKGALFANREL